MLSLTGLCSHALSNNKLNRTTWKCFYLHIDGGWEYLRNKNNESWGITISAESTTHIYLTMHYSGTPCSLKTLVGIGSHAGQSKLWSAYWESTCCRSGSYRAAVQIIRVIPVTNDVTSFENGQSVSIPGVNSYSADTFQNPCPYSVIRTTTPR